MTETADIDVFRPRKSTISFPFISQRSQSTFVAKARVSITRTFQVTEHSINSLLTVPEILPESILSQTKWW